MPTVINMPKIGVNMTEGKIIRWVVNEGDTVREGDHILDAETDKAAQEIYAAASGVIVKILAQEGTNVLCQTPIAILAGPGEKLQEEALESNSFGASKYRVRISPLAKKLAMDMGIPIDKLKPGNTGSRIVKADVLDYHSKNTPVELKSEKISNTLSQDQPDKVIPYDGVRRVIGMRMSESNQTKPSVALTLHADVERLMEWREGLRKSGKKVGYNEIIALIAAKALKEQPIINSKLADDEIHLIGNINIGIAVDTEKGLVVPVIRNADKKGLMEISEDFQEKVAAVKSGKASHEDLSGGTFTVTNLGMYEIESFVPIINPPECCILALGAIVREPVAGEDDRIVIKSRMQLTLVFDHRIVDGAPAAKFLQRVKHLVERPMDLLN